MRGPRARQPWGRDGRVATDGLGASRSSNTSSLLDWLGVVRSEREPRTTLVITTHDPRVLGHTLVERVVTMSDGAIVEDATVSTT